MAYFDSLCPYGLGQSPPEQFLRVQDPMLRIKQDDDKHFALTIMQK